MADFTTVVKGAVAKSIEAIGNAANSLANTTKNKVDEMNLNERRREKLAEFTALAYEVWKNGVPLPKELDEMLTEVAVIDGQLGQLRADRAAAKTEEPAVPTIQVAQEAAQPAAVNDDTVPVTPLPPMSEDEVTIEAQEEEANDAE